ncbi:STAS domain-containing protein [Nocardioides sp. URHA0020]|uniref:STAS domain-containing protein n=1 Tax=Nocardioides sp. URHA0020 TaxID=1380392 RepID=UPI00048C8FDE|nr:STAS domain-containing protein [Nocardioides sp. URHA0020]
MYCQLLIIFAARRATLRLADGLDGYGEQQLQRRIDDALTAGCDRLAVDCARVERIQRESLIALSATKEHLQARGGSLVVRSPSRAFVHAAELAGCADLLERSGPPGPIAPRPGPRALPRLS